MADRESMTAVIEETGCGVEIAVDAVAHDYTPRLIAKVGAGDQALSLYECSGAYAIDTNGGAVWQESDPEGFEALRDQIYAPR